MNKAIEADKEKHPECFYSQMSEQQCSKGSDNNYFCTVIKRAQRMCPGQKPVDIYVHKEERNDDSGSMGEGMISNMPPMPGFNGMEGAIFNEIFNGIAGGLFGRHFENDRTDRNHHHSEHHDHRFQFPGGFGIGPFPFPFGDFPKNSNNSHQNHNQKHEEFDPYRSRRLPPHWHHNESNTYSDNNDNIKDKAKTKSKVVDVPRGPIDRI